MTEHPVTALAHPNIAFIKYWGNRDARLRLPLTGSLSMNMDGLETRTTVKFDNEMVADSLVLNGSAMSGEVLARVVRFLGQVRTLAKREIYASVVSSNSFPSGAGVASSASGFAALALAASHAIGLDLDEAGVSRLARLGSGSACRSVPEGFVEWKAGDSDMSSYASSIAPASHWDLVDMVCIVNPAEKAVGSTEGHSLAQTSPLNQLRLEGVPKRLLRCREAILKQDFEELADVVTADSEWMHAVMRTSVPPLYYWTPDTEILLWYVHYWRGQGHALCATVDAGPNVHVIGLEEEQEWALTQLRNLPGVQQVMIARPGAGAKIVEP